jgi:putative transposase
MLRRERESRDIVPVNAKRVYRVMRVHGLLLQRRPPPPRPRRRHDGKVAVAKSNQRRCSDGFEFRCDNGEPLHVTFALDCCDRDALSWAAKIGGHSGDVVRDAMLAAVENRFGDVLTAPTEIEWLTDNGSGYTAEKTGVFASGIGLKRLTTPVCSPQSNGMAKSFVKTMKRDYVAFMAKPDAASAARNLAVAFEHYNEKHPHSALKYRSPREFRRTLAQEGI